MKIRRLLLPTLALGAAGVLVMPEVARSWSLLGHNLNAFQRTVRVYNNFTAPGANNNNVANDQYPGWFGANMALWKAAAEWGSEPHGDGSGDPSQAIIGSGNANFDAHWSGETTGSGVIGNNIMSQIAGCNGGVFAFMQGGGAGWWIRFYQCWSWSDGPGSIGGTEADLQGIGCHEYGHALGLGHTNIFGATMYASTGTGVISTRSIEGDDIAGLQAIYGAKVANKPRITGLSGQVTLTIEGQNFPASNVEVWFTPRNPTTTGNKNPIKVTNLSSSNGGTRITVGVPATAGPGDVMVRNQTQINGNGLSNAFPFDPDACPAPTTFCTGKVTSLGLTPTVSWTGTNSYTVNDLELRCFLAVPNKVGIYFYSDTGTQAVPFSGGTLCLTPPLKRSQPFVFDQFGRAFQPINIQLFDVGITRYFQFWGRDGQASFGTMLSDAAMATFCL